MAARKKAGGGPLGADVAVILEDIRSKFSVFGEALQGMQEHMEREFREVRRDLGEVRRDLALVQSATLTHSREIRALQQDVRELRGEVQGLRGDVQRVEAKVKDHGARLDKLEGAAE